MILYFDNVNLEVTYPSGDLLIQVSPLILKHIIMNVMFDINVFKLHGTNTYYLNYVPTGIIYCKVDFYSSFWL